MNEAKANLTKLIDDILKDNPGISTRMLDGRPMYYINLPDGTIKKSRNPATLVGMTLTINGHVLSDDAYDLINRML